MLHRPVLNAYNANCRQARHAKRLTYDACNEYGYTALCMQMSTNIYKFATLLNYI